MFRLRNLRLFLALQRRWDSQKAFTTSSLRWPSFLPFTAAQVEMREVAIFADTYLSRLHG